MKRYRFAKHYFQNLEDSTFCAKEYSQLKFGSDLIAKKYGHELAISFFNKYSAYLMANDCVVIPSPYNHVKNAATIMTEHFTDKINQLLINSNGNHVEYSTIHRKVTYTNDYGFLSKEKRKSLINNDDFYFNKQFIGDKTLIFIDDVMITGTHEEKLIDVMKHERLDNPTFFLYYASYNGTSPDIEAKMNFASINNSSDYAKLILSEDCHVIVRTIKYLLGLPQSELVCVLPKLPTSILSKIYYGALGEGYYKIPSFQKNVELIKNELMGEKQ
jgi:hypothetical protein